MTADEDQALGARLEKLLRAQANSRQAPRWISDFLAGETADTSVEEQGEARMVVTGPDGDSCEIELRLAFRTPPPVGKRPWRPAGAGLPREGIEKLSYIVVDEIVGDDADVSISPWPLVDDRGRLLLPAEQPLGVHAVVETLRAYVNRADVRAGRRSIDIRMGTALAAVVRTKPLAAGETRLEKWLVPPVYDITAPARDKAKASFYAAVAPALHPKEVKAIREAASE
jgi:hypothetical protein